ncbi:hypothetical protein ACFYTV_28965 [Streptomyces sp. NPDC004562]|uniref:hypothetical protein n=1 Tax=Streptomyces sp. NPDC004562 TaxID=3364703 RepID=UPI0036A57C98
MRAKVFSGSSMRRPLMLAAAAALLLCVGCSATDGGGPDEAEAAASSSKAASDAPSAVQEAVAALREDSAGFRQKIEVQGDGQVYRITITGGFDFSADEGHLAVDFPGGGIDHSEQVFAEGKIYVRNVLGTGEDTWGAIPRDKAQAHYLLRAPLNDPEHVLQQIAAMRKVSREGEESVEGARAVHYRGILDHRTVTLRMAADVRTKMGQARDILGGDLPVFADAWVDGKGNLVQTRMSANMSGARVTVTTVLSDIGEPVRVKVPRAADTTPISEATGVLNG